VNSGLERIWKEAVVANRKSTRIRVAVLYLEWRIRMRLQSSSPGATEPSVSVSQSE
jgi:hypothetical protein